MFQCQQIAGRTNNAAFTSYKTEINEVQAEINKTDCEIDQMVYNLYGLTEKEIAEIENAIK